ncbi:MAG TPA: FAD-dependent oxidoreductase [Clostridiales bacterium]|nr:FAD-dependent oxidoreductase [Clostridiales bacterium]
MNQSFSYWMETSTPPEFPAYQGDQSCDVAVIGGGLTGITTATLLAQKGLRTVVLEANKVGSGTTSKTTAKITIQHSLKYQQYIRGIGTENTAMYAKANLIDFELIQQLIKENNIDCDYTTDTAYVYTLEEKHLNKLENEKKAYDKLKLESYLADQCKLPFPISGAFAVPKQAYFHPLKYLYALTEVLRKSKGEIYEHSHVKTVDKESGVVHVNGGTLHAKHIILATNYPFLDMPGYYFIRIFQMRSYLTQTQTPDYALQGMYINVGNPVHTMRSHGDATGNHLLLGGYNHKTGHQKNEKPIYEKIDLVKQNYFPFIKNPTNRYWSTQDSVTLDHLPYIGRLSAQTPNVFIATGYDKWGMTNSAAAALILAHEITTEKHPIMETKGLFSPARFTPGAAAKEFLFLGADAVKEYTLTGLTIPKGDIDKIRKGEGKVIRSDGQIIAVYRDENGDLSAFDAHCTHRICPLTFNKTEKSWDCPCHGSRFDVNGDVISGPAVEPLKKYTIKSQDDV